MPYPLIDETSPWVGRGKIHGNTIISCVLSVYRINSSLIPFTHRNFVLLAKMGLLLGVSWLLPFLIADCIFFFFFPPLRFLFLFRDGSFAERHGRRRAAPWLRQPCRGESRWVCPWCGGGEKQQPSSGFLPASLTAGKMKQTSGRSSWRPSQAQQFQASREAPGGIWFTHASSEGSSRHSGGMACDGGQLAVVVAVCGVL